MAEANQLWYLNRSSICFALDLRLSLSYRMWNEMVASCGRQAMPWLQKYCWWSAHLGNAPWVLNRDKDRPGPRDQALRHVPMDAWKSRQLGSRQTLFRLSGSASLPPVTTQTAVMPRIAQPWPLWSRFEPHRVEPSR